MGCEDLKTQIARHPFFEGLDAKYIDLLANHAQTQVFKAGKRIFTQDSPADQFYVVCSGKVTVEVPAIFGAPARLQCLKDGEILGWSWLIPPYTWHFDARADSECILVILDGKSLREKCEEDHTLGYELFKRFSALMSDRLQAARIRVMSVYGDE